MPSGLIENILDFDNVEDMIDKSLVKLEKILNRWQREFLDEDLYKELQDVIKYQIKIKQHVKILLDSHASQGKM